MKFYADKFRKIREMRGLTQGDIADALDYKRQAVQRWEQELTSPKARMVPRLAEVLNCSVQDISDMITEEDLTKGKEMSKLIQIDEKFLEEVKQAAALAGSVLAFAEMIEVAHTTVRDWLTGKAQQVRSDVYERTLKLCRCLLSGEKRPANPEKTYAGKVLRAIRKLRGMSAEEITEKIQANPQTIYGYERGLYQPKMKNTEKLFSLLNVDFHVFEQKILAFPAMAPRELARLIIAENPEEEIERNDTRNPIKVFEGKVLKSIRLIRGIYGPEIQDRLGISTNSLYDYEKGRSFPKAEYAEKLLEFMGLKQPKFQNTCRFNFRSGKPVEQTVKQLIVESEMANKGCSPEENYDELVIAAVRHGLKNLTAEEKTILFRMIVNFTTQSVKKAYFNE